MPSVVIEGSVVICVVDLTRYGLGEPIVCGRPTLLGVGDGVGVGGGVGVGVGVGVDVGVGVGGGVGVACRSSACVGSRRATSVPPPKMARFVSKTWPLAFSASWIASTCAISGSLPSLANPLIKRDVFMIFFP